MSESVPHRKSLPLAVLLFLITSVVLIGMGLIVRFNGFKIFDDAYMFARYADALIETGSLEWNAGHGPVYGATSVLYVFMLVPFRLIFQENVALSLFASSFFWGLMFVGLMFRMALRSLVAPATYKVYFTGFLLIALAVTVTSLHVHFASGMETTFAMAYLAFYLILFLRMWEGKGALWPVAVVAGLAWWVRPDLLVLVLGVPGALLLMSVPEERMRLLKVIGIALAINALLVVLSAIWIGSALPMSFFAKSTGIYGAAFAKRYAYIPIAEFSRFVARNWPIFLVIGMGIWLKWDASVRDIHRFTVPWV